MLDDIDGSDAVHTRVLRIGLYVVAAATIIILGNFVFELRRSAEEQARADFRAVTNSVSSEIESRVKMAINDVNSVGAFFESSPKVDEYEFARFVIRSRFLEDARGIRALTVMPVLARHELDDFNAALKDGEAARRQAGYPPFEVQPVEGRDIYAPVVYVEAPEGRENILGYDLASSPERLAAALAALQSSQPHMTVPIRLSQDTGAARISVLIVGAVKADGDIGLREYLGENTARTLFVAASFSPALSVPLIMSTLGEFDGMGVRIRDITDPEPLDVYRSDGLDEGAPAIVTDRMVLGNRVWEVAYFAGPEGLEFEAGNRYLALAVICGLLILALTVTLDRLLKTSGDLEKQVRERTEQLNSLNKVLSETARQASVESEAKSQFLAHMSHELRTPLNAVIGYAQMILSEVFGKIGDKRYVDYLHTIEDAGKMQLQLVEDILSLTALQAGKRELENVAIDLSTLIDKCVELVRTRSEEKGVDVVVQSTLRDQRYYGDERSLQQILLNLLSNAIKFTPSGGQIDVVLMAAQKGFVRLQVSDTGVGIAEEYLEKVLQPFGQAHVNRYNAYEGVGLGLSIVKGLVEASGGSIRIESELGRGTDIFVDLPLAKGGEDSEDKAAQ